MSQMEKYWVNVFDPRWPQADVVNRIRERSVVVCEPQEFWTYEKYAYTGVGQYKKLEEGEIGFDQMWDTKDTYFFQKEVMIPRTAEPRDWYLDFQIGGECEVYIDGIAAGSLDKEHHEVLAAKQTLGGFVVSVKIQATRHAHDFVMSKRAYGKDYGYHIFQKVQLVTREESLMEFADLVTVLLQFMDSEWLDVSVKEQIHESIKVVLYTIDCNESLEQLKQQVASAKEVLIERIHQLPVDHPFGEVLFMGHSHLDLVFKWLYRETHRKMERTLSNTVRMMEQYPEVTYLQSQMEILETVASDYPALFQEVKQRVEEGRIEVVGDTYVEFDTNLPSGESLIRQFLYGKSIAHHLMGTDSKVCFLPDTFGYSGILPQILKQAGFQYFVTAKLSWNDTNQPKDLSFLWRGIDGSEVRTHLIDNYGGNPDPARLERMRQDKRREQMIHGEKMPCQYGAGDGGGGISDEMIRTIRAIETIDVLAKVKHTTLEKACEEVFYGVEDGQLPVRNGELYFEKHRGVYTSQAKIKKGNRKLELALQELEALWTFYEMQAAAGEEEWKASCRERMKQGWKTLLLHQFHDIISGTCIQEAVREAEAEYQKALALCETVREEILDRVIRKDSCITLWNPTGVLADGIIKVELPYPVKTLGGAAVQMLPSEETDRKHPYVGLVSGLSVDAFGFLPLSLGEKTELPVYAERICDCLENSRYRICLDEVGEIVSLYDKRQNREILRGKGNMLCTHVDRGGYFEAWDITEDIERKVYPIHQVEEMVLTEDGPWRKTLRITKTFGNSKIIQKIRIYEDSPRIDFDTWADFQERQMLLKAGFDVDVDAPMATYDISMGSLQRETTRKDSYEKAKFEVLTHKYMDLSQEDHGVAILNDCKYGCDIKGNHMRITLIKTAEFPDPTQDRGIHEFCYSLYPHAGNEKQANVRKEAYLLNQPVKTIQGAVDFADSVVEYQEDGVLLETIKKAENQKGVILRFYEHYGKEHELQLHWKLPLKTVTRCDILERETDQNVQTEGQLIKTKIKPYEIVTLRIQ